MASFFEQLSNIWTNVKPILPAVAEGVGSYASYLTSTEGNDDAAQQYSLEQQRAADILKAGYDQQLSETEGGLKNIEDLYQQGYKATTGTLGQATDEYGNDLRRSVSTYSDMLYPEYDAYGDNMYATAEDTGQLLDETGQQFQQQYQPYLDAGGEATGQMRTIAASDPNQLTAEQEIALKDYDKNAMATIAASGLRGSGAGIAAVLDGRQRMKANFMAQNQGRGDAARSTLSNQGYGATGQVAGNTAKLGMQKASNLYQTGGDVAKTGFLTSQDVANKYLSSEGGIASNKMNTGKATTELTGKLYGGLTDTEQTRTEARGNTALSKAIADAAATKGSSNVNLAANVGNTKTQGDTIGKIANAVSSAIKTNSQGTPATGGATTTPWRYTDLLN